MRLPCSSVVRLTDDLARQQSVRVALVFHAIIGYLFLIHVSGGNMSKKLSIVSLIVSCAVCGFLVLEFTRPTSSSFLLIGMAALSALGFLCSVIGVRRNWTGLSVMAVVVGSLAMTAILVMFFIMLAMGS